LSESKINCKKKIPAFSRRRVLTSLSFNVEHVFWSTIVLAAGCNMIFRAEKSQHNVFQSGPGSFFFSNFHSCIAIQVGIVLIDNKNTMYIDDN
jgi:hypothetical protein